MATQENITVYKQLVQARQIFMYFLISMNTGLAAFIGNYLLNNEIKDLSAVTQGFLVLTLLTHGTGIFIGLYYQNEAQDTMERNFSLLKKKESPKPSDDKVLKKQDRKLECLHKFSVRVLALGIGLFILTFIIIVFTK